VFVAARQAAHSPGVQMHTSPGPVLGYHFSRALAGGVSDTYPHLHPTALRDGRPYYSMIALAPVLLVQSAGYWSMSEWGMEEVLPGIDSWLIVQ
jgi:hypothetical protein